MSKCILLVKGGTPKSAGSNRMKELSTELDIVLTDNAEVIGKDFDQLMDTLIPNICKGGEVTIEHVVRFFELMLEEDYHIVGSKDYVYRSDQMLKLVKMVQSGEICKGTPLNFFPRTAGFRDTMNKLLDSK